MKKLEHGMLLDAKQVMDDPLPRLEEFKELIPEVLHDRADRLIASIEDELVGCDESPLYVGKQDFIHWAEKRLRTDWSAMTANQIVDDIKNTLLGRKG